MFLFIRIYLRSSLSRSYGRRDNATQQHGGTLLMLLLLACRQRYTRHNSRSQWEKQLLFLKNRCNFHLMRIIASPFAPIKLQSEKI